MKNLGLESEQGIERLAGHVDAVQCGEVKGLSVYLDADTVQAITAHRDSMAEQYAAANIEPPTIGALVRGFLRDSLNKKAVKNG